MRRLGLVLAAAAIVAGVVAGGLVLTSGVQFAPYVRGASLVGDPSRIFRPERPGHLVATSVESTDVASARSRIMNVDILGNPPECWSVGRITVDYYPDRVFVGIYGGIHRLPANTICPDVGHPYRLTLALEEAIGERNIESVEILTPYEG